MQKRISEHLRSNVVGYLAVFIALSGTAYATHPGGANTISSTDIINEEVKGADLAPNSVGSGKIADRQVKNADLSIGASSSNTIADGGIQGVDVKNDTLTGAQIDESTLFNDNSLTGDDIDESTLTDIARGSGRIQKVDFRANANTGFTQILDLGGLRLFATCETSKDLRFFYQSDVDDASARSSYSQFGDASAHADFNNNVDAGFLYEPQFSFEDNDDRVGGIFVYSRPDGGSVSVSFQAEDSEGSAGSDAFGGTRDCMFTGTATHTP